MFLGIDIGGVVVEAITNGIDLIIAHEDGSTEFIIGRISIGGLTTIAQILALIILLLIVRFKFWNVVTGIIEGRKKVAKKDLEDARIAKQEAEATLSEATTAIQEAKEESKEIIQKAKNAADAEANKIKDAAYAEIESKKQKAEAEIAQQEKELRKNLQKEIVDVAYCLADKMIAGQMDEQKTAKVINEYLESENEKHE